MKSQITSLFFLLFALVGVSQAEPTIQDGTLLYVWNGNNVVQGYTDSKVTHVGLIINVNDEAYLYEADVPQVRRVPFKDYLAMIAIGNKDADPEDIVTIRLIQPSVPFTGDQIKAMKEYLDGKIGTRYSIRSYIHKKPVISGMHCAELTTNALNATGRYKFTNPSATSPKALVHYMAGTYGETQVVSIKAPVDNLTWCDEQKSWWGRTFAWCEWSCIESGSETLHWAVPSVEKPKDSKQR